MQTYHHKKIEKIDLQADYPCPCCRRGQLSVITLTDALGCERCQEIFVLHEDGYLLEGLKTAYPYPKKWYWTGGQWTVQSPSPRWPYLSPPLIRFTTIALLFAILAILIGAVLPLLPPLSNVWWGILLGMIVGFFGIFWHISQG